MLIGGETESGWCECEVRRPLVKTFAALAFTVLVLIELFEMCVCVGDGFGFDELTFMKIQ